MPETTLDLAFKGARDYLHGTDVFNQTLSWLENALPDAPIQDIDFSFHHLARHRIELILGALPEGVEAFAVCSFSQAGQRQKAYLIETEEPVTGRYPYPEDEMVAPMEYDLAAKRGVLRGSIAYSDIEIWVAMTKALHYKVFPQYSGKWLFVRGRFPRYSGHTQADERTLVIAASFNDRLTRSEVLLDGQKVGEIYFSIV